MAEVAALASLRWAASPVVKKLIAEASTYLGVAMARELQDLETTVLPQFDLVIEAAEQSPHRDKVKAFLQRLKEAFYDAEDLLDEHEYNILERKAKGGSNSVKATTFLKPLRAATSRARNLLGENRKMIDKMNELKAILVEARTFRELLGLPSVNTAGWPAVPKPAVPPAITVTNGDLLY